MQPDVFPELALLEYMEAKTCCAYNATKGCRINSTVTVADSMREPLKLLKVLVEGLARDSKSSLWLTPLQHAPQLTRIFPFDLAYLDSDMKVQKAMALQPETPAPQFRAEFTSALILPFNCLQSSGTVPGDLIIVCAEEELESRLAEISSPAVAEPVAQVAEGPIAATSRPLAALPKFPLNPFPSSQVSVRTLGASIPQGAGFTVGMTASSWQISNSTTSSAVLEPGEIREASQEEAEEAKNGSEKLGEIALTETEGTEAREERGANGNLDVNTSEGVSDLSATAEVSESTREDVDLVTTPEVAAEREGGAAGPEIVPVEPEAASENTAVVEKNELEGKARTEVSGIPAESEPVVEKPDLRAETPALETEVLTPRRTKTTEDVPPKVTAATGLDPVTTKKKGQEEKKKESLGVLVKRFLNCEDPLPERRSIIRLLVQGLVAYTGNGEEKREYEVRDVSPTGVYLRTQERWRPGDVVSLVLQRKGATNGQFERRVTVDLRAVRCDEEGVGFAWMWPDGVELDAWKRVHTKRSDETDADYFLRELRLTRALGFLRQICPTTMEEIKLGLHKRLSNKRVASAVEITMKAQELLGQLEPGAKVMAHPDMVRRILENGSWTEDDWIRQWWGGLLVSSCSVEAPDTSNSVFVDLLAKLMPVHLHVLQFVCRRANELIDAGELAAKLDLYCTSEELIEAVGSHSLARIQQTLGQLSSLGLLAESNKPSYVAVTDKVKTRATPTALGLTMYGRCNGRR